MKRECHTLSSEKITAVIKSDGAELISLRNAQGLELLWQAGPEWPRHAPILFPIVGRLKNDELRYRGKSFPMTQHGFARDRRFEWAEKGDASCTLTLHDDASTRSQYPFAFRLDVTYAVENGHLDVIFEIVNIGDDILPASIGAHPAFNWPLLPSLSKDAYVLTFSQEEREPIRRLEAGLLRETSAVSPIKGRVLALTEHLFQDDAVILDKPSSTSVRYGADQGPSIEVSWQSFRQLGLWSKVGAPFICIEPWRGTASPSHFDGEFTGKPGLMLIEPGTKELLTYRIRVE